jgi:G:T-mismatch repair DNA endonuclease (very short patch repair protein)
VIPLRPVNSAEDALERAREVMRRRRAAYQAIKPELALVKPPRRSATIYTSPIGPDLPKTGPRDFIWVTKSKPARQIVREICEMHDVTLLDLSSSRRAPAIIEAKNHLYFRLRRETDMSFPQIGLAVKKDHTSVMHGYYSYLHSHPEEMRGSDRQTYRNWSERLDTNRERNNRRWKELQASNKAKRQAFRQRQGGQS